MSDSASGMGRVGYPVRRTTSSDKHRLGPTGCISQTRSRKPTPDEWALCNPRSAMTGQTQQRLTTFNRCPYRVVDYFVKKKKNTCNLPIPQDMRRRFGRFETCRLFLKHVRALSTRNSSFGVVYENNIKSFTALYLPSFNIYLFHFKKFHFFSPL